MREIYKIAIKAACVLAVVLGGCSVEPTQFVVRIENVSQDAALVSPFAPGVFAVHDRSFALFVEEREHRGFGIEALAEDGNPAGLAENIVNAPGVTDSGVFAVPLGRDVPGPLLPNTGAYEFSVLGSEEAQYLSFATMLVESNDLFFAPNDRGILLFRFGGPIEGDVTHHVRLWDAGTEVNEEPGTGAYQPLRQIGPNTGPNETEPIKEVNDRFDYPAVDQMIRVTVTPQ